MSVVVPAYCEAGRIAATVQTLREGLSGALDGVELVVVDDGSGDGTAEAARQAGADQVLELDENRGKGAAVRAGVLAARGRSIAYTDADLSYPPADLIRLLQQVEASGGLVVGSRRHAGSTTLVQPSRLRQLSGRIFNLVAAWLVLGEERDTQCGLKAFPAPVGRQLLSSTHVDGFAFDVELFVLARRRGIPVVEVPVSLSSSSDSTVRVVADAARMVRDLLRIRGLARHGAYDEGGRPGR